MFPVLVTALELGLLYGIAALGVFLAFRILDFPDLSADGSFVTGAAVTALALKGGVPPYAAIVLGFFAATLAGLMTAALHVRFGISKILSGIIGLSMLYTLNLRIMGSANISLLNETNLISWFAYPVNHAGLILFLIAGTVSLKCAVDWLLRTQFGLFVRAVGQNEGVVRSLGFPPERAKYAMVALANGLVGLSGGLVAQNQGFVDVNMGIGILILGLASFMIGDALFGGPRASVGQLTGAVLGGSIAYQLVIALSLRFGLPATDLKLVSAIIVVAALVAGKRKGLYARAFFGN